MSLPTELPDTAGAELIELLCEIARILGSYYAGQFHRYVCCGDTRPQDLWDHD